MVKPPKSFAYSDLGVGDGTLRITITMVKRFLRDAMIAFIYWTLTLTPYMILVVRTNLEQYLAWVLMQALLVPPLGAVSAILFRWIDRKS